MSATPSQIEFLRSLNSRVKTASEHFSPASESADQPNRRRSAPPLEHLIPHAERISFGNGNCLRIESRVALDGSRSAQGYVLPGGQNSGTVNFQCVLALLARDEKWNEVDPDKIVYLDVETTSLSGGTGTVAFLIGVGRVVGGEFLLRQFFMEDYCDEEALIEAVGAEMQNAQGLVSYNGRCFDLPILESRWRMARRRPEFPDLHLDLLHPSRRLWKRRLPDCRLGTLEREILGVVRFSDVESSAIPQIYFAYLRGVGRERIISVMDHHAQDVLSLGGLARTLVSAIHSPDDSRFRHAEVQWGLSQIFHSANRTDESLDRLERAILATRDEDFGFRLSMHLARRLARLERWSDAVAIWEARVPQARAGRLDPLIELAKHAEHRVKDFASARRWTERALEIAHAEEDADNTEALLHRLERLRRRG